MNYNDLQYVLDCFVPRNDGICRSSLRACEAIQKPDVHLDCFVPRNDVKTCEAIQVRIIPVPTRCSC